MAMTLDTTLFVPPGIGPGVETRSVLAIARVARTNALLMWPAAAYERAVLVQSDVGQKRFLLNGEAGIHRVLVGNARNYGRTPASIRILRPIAGDGLLLSEGESWRRQRQVVAPTLAPRVMPILAGHIVRNTEAALAGWAAGVAGFDALAAMQGLTLEIASRSMFSMALAADGAALRSMLTAYGKVLGRPALLDFLMPLSLPSPRDVRRAWFRLRWRRLMERMVGARLLTPAETPARDLFDLLRAATDPQTGAPFTRAQLRDQVATLLLAGHETTALTLFWTLYLLANAPAVQARVAEEVCGFDAAAAALQPNLKALPYTKAVVQEALRLYPPAFTIVRRALAADVVEEVAIPAGAIVLIAPWVLHRHRDFWREPAAFDPSRFEGEPDLAHRFAYLPFGAGPRVCVGAQFALTEAVFVVAMLLQRLRVEMEAGEAPVRPMAVITTAPERAVRLRVSPR